MSTTLLADTAPRMQGRRELAGQLISVILAINYLIIVLFSELDRFELHHGRGGREFSPVVFLGLLLALTALHLAVLVPGALSGQKRQVLGTALISFSFLTGGILLFSGPSGTLLRFSYPTPSLVYILLILSIGYGLFLVLRPLPVREPLVIFPPDPVTIGFPAALRQRYGEVRFLASGGVGTVWYAIYAEDQTEVAVKIPSRSDEQTGKAFLQEIQLWKELSHPHIARIRAANILPVPYLEMEYLPGSLATQPVPLSPRAALTLMEPVIAALSYAHQQGVVHCDIKPGNILLTHDGVPKVTDWGLSRGKDAVWAIHGFSARYAAPEQSGQTPECGPAVDVYQSGLILSWLLTGSASAPVGSEPVFSGEGGQTLLTLITRCLHRDPRDRYPDCTALLQALTGVAAGLSHQSDPPSGSSQR